MTNKEMSEIFAVWMLAYPNAEMFKGGIEKLEPTIKLWTKCFKNLDFETAQRAAIHLCKTSAFPPTIAEYETVVKSLYAQSMISSSTMWAKLVNAAERIYDIMPCFRYTRQMKDGRIQGAHYRDKAAAIYEELPGLVKEYVGSFSAMLQLAIEFDACNGRAMSYERDKFEKYYLSYFQSAEIKQLVSAGQIGVLNEQISLPKN
ncbi:MAG: replicative helicase loader/inhibitor [Acutalibacteraceae bacterium]